MILWRLCAEYSAYTSKFGAVGHSHRHTVAFDRRNKKASIRRQHSAPPISISLSVHFTRASVLWYTMEANSRYHL